MDICAFNFDTHVPYLPENCGAYLLTFTCNFQGVIIIPIITLSIRLLHNPSLGLSKECKECIC